VAPLLLCQTCRFISISGSSQLIPTLTISHILSSHQRPPPVCQHCLPLLPTASSPACPLPGCMQKSSSPSPSDPSQVCSSMTPMKKQGKPFTHGAAFTLLRVQPTRPVHRSPPMGFRTALSTRDQRGMTEIISHDRGAINHQTHQQGKKILCKHPTSGFFSLLGEQQFNDAFPSLPRDLC